MSAMTFDDELLSNARKNLDNEEHDIGLSDGCVARKKTIADYR